MHRSIVTLALLAGCSPPPAWTSPLVDLDRAVLSVWAPTPKEAFFAGGGLGSGPGALALHYDGRDFVDLRAATAATLWWVFGHSPRDVWFVGEQGTILRWDGAAFTAHPSGTTATLFGVWGSAPDDVWAVGGVPGQSAVVLHFDGRAWSSDPTVPAVGGALFKIWGAGRDAVFAVGEGGAVRRFDGRAWSSPPSGVARNLTLFTVAGRGPSEVYAVGGLGSGVAIRWDGQAFAPLAGLPEVAGLTGVAVDGAGDLALVGFSGTKLRRPAGAALIDESRTPPRSDLHAVAVAAGDEIWAVGGNYNAPRGAPRAGVVAHFGAPIAARLR